MNQQSPAIWRINLKPGSATVDSRAFCIEEGLLGVGWGVTTSRSALDYEAYDALAKKKYPDDNGRAAATKALKYRMQMKFGDRRTIPQFPFGRWPTSAAFPFWNSSSLSPR